MYAGIVQTLATLALLGTGAAVVLLVAQGVSVRPCLTP